MLFALALWVSVSTNPAVLSYYGTAGVTETISYDDRVTDIQAIRISRNDEPYVVVLLKTKRKLRLKLYDDDLTLLATRTVRAVQEPYRIGAARIEYLKNAKAVQVRFIRMNDTTDEPVTYLRKRFSIKPDRSQPIAQLRSTTTVISEPTGSDVLDYLGAARLSAGMLPVKRNTSLDYGCALHAEYMRLNDEMTHDEDASKPGYTEEGAAAGVQSVITYQFDNSMISALDLWLEAPYHRFSLLYPEFTSTGWAMSDALYYNEYYNKYFACLNSIAGTEFDSSGYDKNVTYWDYDNHEPIPYPGVNQLNVPILFHGNEEPDPLEALGGTYPTGYAVSLIFPVGNTITDANVTLVDENGNNHPGYLRTPYEEDDPNASYQGNAVLFMAEDPFDYGTTYTATVTATRDGEAYEKTWSFRTTSDT
ncbi:MAG: SCP-like protein extracellular [uncultured bacterium]|nr:MAG: SCP-like protein extracellular [uncultured bacterium]HBY73821.1 hypothetical protein [Candidatus Kerfeldbacteria bacterium]